jgi:hypothetical protein
MLFGVATYLISQRLVTHRDKAPVMMLGMTSLQVTAYTLAGAIVAYTMLISCSIDVGDTRQRVPTDGLILLMFFLGAHVWWRSVSLSGSVPKKALTHETLMGASQ